MILLFHSPRSNREKAVIALPLSENELLSALPRCKLMRALIVSEAPLADRSYRRYRSASYVEKHGHGIFLVSLLNAGGGRMPQYRSGLPQLSGDIFLTDAGVETDLIFNHGIEIR